MYNADVISETHNNDKFATLNTNFWCEFESWIKILKHHNKKFKMFKTKVFLVPIIPLHGWTAAILRPIRQ